MGDSNPVKYFCCGGFGGICTILSGHPLDTIKVRLQTMPKPAPGEQPLYSGTLDCAKKIIAKEGVAGLFKGMSAPLVGVTPMFALSFFGFGLGKSLLQPAGNAPLTNAQLFAAGSFSGVVTTIIAAPVERMKCLLQMQEGAGEKKYNGMFDCAKKLYKEGGIASIYKGTCATLLRDIPGAGTYFLTYEFCQSAFKASFGKDVGLMAAVASGGMSGITFWIVSMPADVLKSILQTAPEGAYPNGIRGVFKELMAKEGPGALYKGVAPVMIRAFPSNAACFFGFELCMNLLTKFGL